MERLFVWSHCKLYYAMKKLLIIINLLLLSACSSEPYVVKPVERDNSPKRSVIYIVSHDWHTGFVIPAEEIQLHIPELRERFGDTPYIEFGWGDKGFYQAKEITTGLVLRAVLWPTESVIHSVAVPERVERYFKNSHVEKICLNSSGLTSLLHFISNSFYKNEKNKVLKLENGIYGNSQFYKGVGDYYLMNTCNKWTAKGLNSAGFDISPTFTLTASSIMKYIVSHNQEQKNTASNGIVSC